MNLHAMMGAVIGVLILVGGVYFWYSQNQIEELASKVAAKEVEIAVQEQTIKNLNEQLTILNDLRRDYDKTVAQIKEQTKRVDRILSEHNLGSLGSRKPNLIEKRVNDGTQEILKAIEDASKGVTK